ncbi:hypothetical protein CASFOL_041494 [Castilleja foliolosa]|uniref:Transmembrane protein n=1 Tax=Castilleja foliolosa TaxID=1961234 RepID=A0ABD3BBT4_9LAMI
MCCGARMCCLCVSLIVVVIAIGFLFGFGVFTHGFDKLKDVFHMSDYAAGGVSRPFLGAPPPY